MRASNVLALFATLAIGSAIAAPAPKAAPAPRAEPGPNPGPNPNPSPYGYGYDYSYYYGGSPYYGYGGSPYGYGGSPYYGYYGCQFQLRSFYAHWNSVTCRTTLSLLVEGWSGVLMVLFEWTDPNIGGMIKEMFESSLIPFFFLLPYPSQSLLSKALAPLASGSCTFSPHPYSLRTTIYAPFRRLGLTDLLAFTMHLSSSIYLTLLALATLLPQTPGLPIGPGPVLTRRFYSTDPYASYSSAGCGYGDPCNAWTPYNPLTSSGASATRGPFGEEVPTMGKPW
ncbi:hypothetical protein BJ684DRAFT_20348 [Piptocephalis cylindrospora]|uniref:Uncharacterized protein n=1 Tax=Piptocephalis cylindrospora TaxID=1907219 RepID=A0A4P9Y386_9FUNG|nr:hypothetical protein BJ684DRAFT_20348 [Piptocephalis cylindrospora]|eukprot:RKP13144.1 hypothetical protein BJ684DRAFT_20348 [Piptocephalis cylindrospora]